MHTSPLALGYTPIGTAYAEVEFLTQFVKQDTSCGLN